MNISTKFNVGDKVWMMHDNKAKELKIYHIQININAKEERIKYSVNNIITDGRTDNKEVWESENRLFSTKEELLKSL